MEIIKKYQENSSYLDNLEVGKYDRIKSFLFGYLISLILMCAPIVITAHFFMYSFYFEVVLAILMIFILVFAILGEIISDKILLHYANINEKIDLKSTYILHTLLYSLMMVLGYVIIILLFR